MIVAATLAACLATAPPPQAPGPSADAAGAAPAPVAALVAAPAVADDAADDVGAALATAARGMIEARVAVDEFAGTVLIAHGEKVLLRDAWGLRDREAGDPNRLDTRFNVGSITKNFTAVAIAQLVEAGELSLDTTVGEVLPDHPRRDVREKVTVRHLLTHTSGVPDWWRPWFRKGRPATATLDEYHDLFKRKRLEFEPGSRPKYSNSGVTLLGLMIEARTGTPYHEAVRARVFEPAGMTRTEWLMIREPVADQAVGYGEPEPERGTRRDGSWDNPGRGGPAGGCYSTVDDMLAFARAMRDGTLWSADSLATFTTRKLDLYPGVGYGYLFFDLGSGDNRTIGHDGGSTGVNAEFHLFPERDVVLVILSNVQYGADKLASDLLGLIGRSTLGGG